MKTFETGKTGLLYSHYSAKNSFISTQKKYNCNVFIYLKRIKSHYQHQITQELNIVKHPYFAVAYILNSD